MSKYKYFTYIVGTTDWKDRRINNLTEITKKEYDLLTKSPYTKELMNWIEGRKGLVYDEKRSLFWDDYFYEYINSIEDEAKRKEMEQIGEILSMPDADSDSEFLLYIETIQVFKAKPETLGDFKHLQYTKKGDKK